jgi:MYXO-CTERM domain-containing protein
MRFSSSRAARCLAVVAAMSISLHAATGFTQNVADVDPRVRVTVARVPTPSITLRWNASTVAGGYLVRRRDPAATAWGAPVMLPATATEHVDRDVLPGREYEYAIQRSTAMGQTIVQGFSYVIAGIDVPYPDERGVVALVVESQTAMGATAEVAQLEADLRDDGWTVARVAIAASASPPSLRAELQRLGSTHGARLRAAILLGAVPRAFSGNISPDGHPDHRGAWPADAYYADLDGVWTDTRDFSGTTFNANRAGDGKFDQDTFPSPLELAVGRVDAERMPAFGMTPVELMRRYLRRDHEFRVGAFSPSRRTWVSDSFGYFGGEAFARVAWRDGNAVHGSDPATGRPFFDALEDPSGGYSLAFGCGPGNPQGAAGVGSTTDFATRNPRAVFVGLFGSYFGDWAYENNFLRAPLFSPSPALASVWFARPYVNLHGLGAMRSFGDEFLRSVQGRGYDSPRGGVHQGLMGDPTLRLFTLRPPTAARVDPSAPPTLRWEPSPDASEGYHVFRRRTSTDATERLTMTPFMGTMFQDPRPLVGEEAEYRVVAVRRETTGSGTFFNHSHGARVTVGPRAPLDAGGVPLDARSFGDGSALAEAGASDVSVADVSLQDGTAVDVTAVEGGARAGGADGGPAATPTAPGCACRAGHGSASLNPWVLMLALVALVRDRRRQRRGVTEA